VGTAKPLHTKETPKEIRSIGARRGGIPTPKAAQEEGEIEKQLAEWRQSLNGTFPGKLEKILTRLIRERDNESVPNVRQFIGRKIKMLHELLDGPKPKPEAPAMQPTRAKSAPGPTDQEILEGARYLVSIGKKDLLTQTQRKALASAK